MTLRRLVLGTLLAAFPGPTPPGWAVDLVAEGLAGHVLFGGNVVDPARLTVLCATLRRARPDVVIAIDEEGGDVTRLGHRDGSPYPGNGALGVIDDPDLTRTIYRSIGADLAAVGIGLDLAPSVDVNSTSDNPVIGTRSFGADPALVARHAVAAVAGLRDAGVASCVKHFPGHGGTTVDSHRELPIVDVPLDVLRARDLPPFMAAAATADAVMTAHIRVPTLTGDAPATFSPAAIQLLRAELGYDGVVITDALEMLGATRYAGGVGPGAVLALRAGADLLCIGAAVTAELVEDVVAHVRRAVDDGTLPIGRLHQATARIRKLHRSGPGSPQASDIGVAAARRAVRVDGALPDLTRALVVQLESPWTIAEGRVPWGVLPFLDPSQPRCRVVARDASADELLTAAGGHPIVVTGRNLHRLDGAGPLLTALAAGAPVVVVEMGWPSAWRPTGAVAWVTTHGASRANSRAAYDQLFGPH